MVDSGNLIAPSTFVSDAERWQAHVKAELLLEGVARSGIDAMTVGDTDFVFGKDFLLGEAKSLHLPYVCANLTYTDTGAPVFPPYLMREVGGVKVGILGLTGQSLKVDGLTASDPIQAARAAVGELKKQGAGLIVALSNQTINVNETLARDVTDIDLVVAGHSRQKLEPPRQIGKALLLEAGNRGKFLGELEITLLDGVHGWKETGLQKESFERAARFRERANAIRGRMATAATQLEKDRLARQLEFYQTEIEKAEAVKPDSGPANAFTQQHVALSSDVADDPEVKALVDKALDRIAHPDPEAVAKLNAEAGAAALVAESMATAMAANPMGGNGHGDFMGAQACMSCHQVEYKQWLSTPHAHAWSSLEKEKREKDFECYGCHITGHGQPGGPSNPAMVGNLTNVQCESCHTAGRQHVADPRGHALPSRVAQTVCLSCHTPEQTGNRFVYAEYLPKVMHTLTALVGKGDAGSPAGAH